MGFTSQWEMKEEYANIRIALERLQYNIHGWLICVNMKIVNLPLDQQGVTLSIFVFCATATVGLQK